MRSWPRIAKIFGIFLVFMLGQMHCAAADGSAANAGTSDRWVETRPTWSATAAEVHPYDPFPVGEHPLCWPMTSAVELDLPVDPEQYDRTREGLDRFYLPGQTPVEITFDFSDTNSASATSPKTVSLLELGKIVEGPWRLPDDSCCACPHLFFGDVNHDRRIDVYAVLANDGCGLAASWTCQVMILSTSTGGWRAWYKKGFFASASDLIVVGDQNAVLSADFVENTGKDGRSHSYWAFDLDAIGDGVITPADQMLTPNFPRWVWYSIKENHAITTKVGRDVQFAQRKKSQWQELPLLKNP